ncbi:hypothetical protein Hanom_Chr12g01122511 [Helianthus anomalus]
MFDQVNHPPGLTWPNSQHFVFNLYASKDVIEGWIVSFDDFERHHSMDTYGPRRIYHPSRYVWILRNLSVDILVDR